MSPPIRAIVFDLFDTLVDLHMENLAPVEHRGIRVAGTAPLLYEALAAERPEVDFDRFVRTLREVDAGFQETRYAKGLELPTLERFGVLVERLGLPATELAAKLTAAHMEALRSQVRNLDHHPAVLASLRARVPLALCSNFSHSDTALRVLREAALAEHLDVVVVSDEKGIRKPRPEIFHDVLEQLGTAPEETLHVGDNLSADVAGAGALGIRTAWVTRRVPDPSERLARHEGPPPDHEIHDLAELADLLDA